MLDTLCATNWALVLEYLKVLLSSQIVIAGTAIFLVMRFRSAISKWFEGRRPTKFEATLSGLVVTWSQDAADQPYPPRIAELAQSHADGPSAPALTSAPSKTPLEHTTHFVDNTLRPDLIDDAAAQSLHAYIAANPGPVTGEIYDVLLWFRFEETLHGIFGSQTKALVFLSAKSEWVAASDLHPFYAQHVQFAQQAARTEVDYFEYLIQRQLVEKSIVNSQVVYRITPGGSKYLPYVQAKYGYKWDSTPG